MRDRLIELLSYIPCNDGCVCSALDGGRCLGLDKLDRCQIQAIADHLLANGVIVQPCKVGDTLYVNYEYLKSWGRKTYPVSVRAIRLDTKKNNHRICVEGKFHLKEDCSHYYQATFSFDSIGKTVFLTREEAERALKGGAE